MGKDLIKLSLKIHTWPVSMWKGVIRELEIKTALSLHIYKDRCNFLKKKKKENGFWRGYGENRTLVHCWWECTMVQPAWNTGCQFLQKLNMKLP